MTDRWRAWIMELVAACLLIALGCVVAGWTVPRLLSFATSPAGLILAGWWVFVALVIFAIGRAAARGDAIAEQALAERRREQDWEWPERDVGVGRSS